MPCFVFYAHAEDGDVLLCGAKTIFQESQIIPGGFSGSTLGREPAVPGIIPGGIARGPMPAKQLYWGWRHQPSFVHTRAVINVLFIKVEDPYSLCPAPWAAWIHGRGRQFLAGQRRWSAVCPGERRGAAGDTQSQASLYKIPQPLYLE